MSIIEEDPPPVLLRILIVEDTPDRQEWLRQLYREHAWVLVHTAARAVRLLAAYEFDLVSLDYNLSGPGDGATVARALADSRNARASVLVHSMNPRGARLLAELVPHAQCVPVNQLVARNEIARRVREALRRGVPTDFASLTKRRTTV